MTSVLVGKVFVVVLLIMLVLEQVNIRAALLL
jgi:hypothetical protein